MDIDITEEDLYFEQEFERDPHHLKTWLHYLDHKQGNIRSLVILYERALKNLPGSYKLWKQYLELRLSMISKKNSVTQPDVFRKTTLCFERSLLYLHKMPRVWMMYCKYIQMLPDVSEIRRVYDRALRALPLTQHERIWKMYLRFSRRMGGQVAERVYGRYLRMWPERQREYTEWCIHKGEWREAVKGLLVELNQQSSIKGWQQLAKIVGTYPEKLQGLDNLEGVVRDGIGRNESLAGELWTGLAALVMQEGHARDVYEEALAKVKTMRDFAVVFDAYAKMEETRVTMLMEAMARGEQKNVELELLRLERLLERRPFMANQVALRQNPKSTREWLRRAQLWMDQKDERKAVETFEQALDKTKSGEVWLAYARYYGTERPNELRGVMDRAVRESEDDTVVVWYAETEMEALKDIERARRVLTGATAQGSPVMRSQKVWDLLVDLEEGLGTLESARQTYDRMIELKVATPQHISNYASFLSDAGYFEDSFRIYERGISGFGYPVAVELWTLYLAKFIERYGETKIERTRELFEEALKNCPKEYAAPLYLAYGELEEKSGLGGRALSIYERAAYNVAGKLEMYRKYVEKTKQLRGQTAARPVYERAIGELRDKEALELVQEYAGMEAELGEIERARALFVYSASMATGEDAMWRVWHEFEIQNGDEETFKEMLRVKRQVKVKFRAEPEVKKVEERKNTEMANPDEVDMDLDDL